MVQNSKKSYYSTDNLNFFNFCAFNISVKLHDLVCRPRRDAAEILIKIKTFIHAHMTPYILPQIEPIRKGPKQWPFPNISVNTKLAADVFIKMV